eukprot:TRINITY_DN36053_c0_g1_i1.p1 TRINITY_DN36053_c0_g1~~TRINITY_DN36053_c0_g1_i1.p1  ORF type:complete len:454 (+),score=77.17 TRINITY_DN36053_c0_g1_i1:52-1413(+)
MRSSLRAMLLAWPLAMMTEGTLVSYKLKGADPACGEVDVVGVKNGCGIHIHTGQSCAKAEFVGGHLWDKKDHAEDPWQSVRYTTSGAEKLATGDQTVSTGMDNEELIGRVFIVHDATGARVACSQLAAKDGVLQTLGFETYPGYTGPLKVTGSIKFGAVISAPSCAEYGKVYHQDSVQSFNGGLLKDSKQCQKSCLDLLTCKFFSYYPASQECWLFDKTATKSPEVKPVAVYSGPETCTKVEDDVTPTLATPAGKTTKQDQGKLLGGLSWSVWALIAFGLLASVALCAGVVSFMSSDRGGRKIAKSTRGLQKLAQTDPDEGLVRGAKGRKEIAIPAQTSAPSSVQLAAPVVTTQPTQHVISRPMIAVPSMVMAPVPVVTSAAQYSAPVIQGQAALTPQPPVGPVEQIPSNVMRLVTAPSSPSRSMNTPVVAYAPVTRAVSAPASPKKESVDSV